MRGPLIAASAASIFFLTGCVKSYSPTACDALDPEVYTETYDPFESTNRAIFDFNLSLDKALMQPTARLYKEIVHDDLKTSISSFYRNLKEPRNVFSAVLMGNVPAAATSSMRFAMNTTVGIFGFVDIADYAGLPYKDYEFGHVMGYWGAGEGPYFVVPLIGPTNLRDSIGSAVHSRHTYVEKRIEKSEHQLLVQNIYWIEARARLLPFTDMLAEQPDPYIFTRESYRQSRLNTICNQ